MSAEEMPETSLDSRNETWLSTGTAALVEDVERRSRRLLGVVWATPFGVVSPAQVGSGIWFRIVAEPNRRHSERLVGRRVMSFSLAVPNQGCRCSLRHPSGLV
jgi:hypothetical protein